MILAAGLLVLAGLGLFVGGLATGTTSWYWSCVACCGVAAVLLIAARLRPASRRAPAAAETARPRAAKPARAAARAAAAAAPAAAAEPAVVAEPVAPAQPEPVRVAARHAATAGTDDGGDPPEEDVEVTDLLMVVDMRDQVLVVDEHPRYHLADCSWLRGRATIPLPVAEARSDGFSPCAVCSPDSHLADLARARRAASKK